MSKETRTVRPFVGLGSLLDIFEGCILHFGSHFCHSGSSITVDVAPREFLLCSVSIEWASDEESLTSFKSAILKGAAAAGLEVDDLILLAVASSSYLKTADIVYSRPLAGLEGMERVTSLVGGARAASFRTPHSGFSVDLYLALSRELDHIPLRPYRIGTWLAAASFRVETSRGPALLPPTPLTPEIRARLNLPAKTLKYLYFGDHDPIVPFTGQEHPVFYVDEQLLAQINARRNSAASKAIQLQLANDFVAAVIRRAAASREVTSVTYDDVRDSLLGSMIRIAAGPGADEAMRNEVLTSLAEDPEHMIARSEHFIDLAGGYAGLLEEASE